MKLCSQCGHNIYQHGVTEDPDVNQPCHGSECLCSNFTAPSSPIVEEDWRPMQPDDIDEKFYDKERQRFSTSVTIFNFAGNARKEIFDWRVINASGHESKMSNCVVERSGWDY